ncbi:unnamed protein product [Euphydryas editha]|uniref:C3H1-type domain-containing protein n=1 Tax=Euphydryas editha TaxID=104508 RepID=A0AAU9V3R3_EUPED|nr:unnamed protein product [Euphydryas editha]
MSSVFVWFCVEVGGVSGAGAAASHLAALDPISLALLAPQATSPYLSGVPGVGSTYAQYYAPQLVPAVLGHDPAAAAASPLGVMQQPVLQQKLPRTDRLEVCREFQRGACKRAESECRFAHPPPPVVAHDDGCVTVCMDAVKGRCVRDPCRYFHPPLHLQAHLKAQARGATAAASQQPAASATSEPGKKRPAPTELEPPPMDMKSVGSFYYDNFAFPGVVPYKRPAADKAGVPVYQPATTYQQLMQLQQPFVPVSCEYPAPASSAPPAAVTAVSGVTSAPQAAPAPPAQSAPPPAPTAPAQAASPPAPSADAPAPDPAAVAKEVAHKNYAAALALAAQQSAMAHAAAAYTQQAFKARAAMPGLMRAPLMMRPGWPAQHMPMPAFYQQPYMYAMPPPTQQSAAAAAAAAAAAVNPYKKMKTT